MEILSVDGGATKTRAVVHNEDRTILGVGVSGSTNFRNVGISTFKRNMLTAIKKAEENAHVNRIDDSIGKRKYKVPLYGYEAIIGSIVMRSISLGFKIGDDEINSLNIEFGFVYYIY